MQKHHGSQRELRTFGTLRWDFGRNMGNSLRFGDASTSGSSSVASSGVIDRDCLSPLRLEVAEAAPCRQGSPSAGSRWVVTLMLAQ